jgi:hypothetical protein
MCNQFVLRIGKNGIILNQIMENEMKLSQPKWFKARKKPVVVDVREPIGRVETIKTREGTLKAYENADYIIKGVKGELYPIDRVIFHETYEVLNGTKCPNAVCLVGSTHPKWKQQYRKVEEELTKVGYVVLSVVWFKDQLPNFERHRDLLETIHFQKIRLADAVVLIHHDAVGKHTAMEIEFAKKIGKPVVTFTEGAVTRACIDTLIAKSNMG